MGGTTFICIKAPCHNDMVELVHTISHRIVKYLEKVDLVQRDMENSYLNLPINDDTSIRAIPIVLRSASRAWYLVNKMLSSVAEH